MTKTPIDYSKIVIYKIVCNDLTVTDLYVGSTTAFTKRKNRHKSNCNNVDSKEYNLKVYQMIRANEGWDNWTMVEIEKFPCNDGNEARARERYHVEFLNANMNMQIPNQSVQESKKNWRKNNKDKIKEKKKIWDEANIDKIKEYNKEYNKANRNKDKINARRRELRKLKKQDQKQ